MTIPLILALPLVSQADLVIDGVADEHAWDQAMVVTEWVNNSPVPGTKPSFETTAKLFADSKALYLHFDARDPEPHKMRTSIGRRDNREYDARVGVLIDPYGVGQRAWFFEVNAHGVQIDGIQLAGQSGRGVSRSWDGRWESETVIHEAGYTVEIAIPWKTIRHPVPLENLGITLMRAVSRTGEKSYWPGLDPEVEGVLVQQAILEGPGTLAPNPGVDLLPEMTFGWSDDGADTSRPNVYGFSPGLTIRASPNPALSVLATANPDFSQVESDRAKLDINQRYALSYEEKRPFFLEGQDTFDHPFSNITYTRAFVSPRYGLRATSEAGKVATGVLHSLDATPSGSVSEGGGWEDEDLEGYYALDTVARTRRSIGRDGHIGALLSDKEILDTNMWNRVAGLDSRVRASDKLIFDSALLGGQTTLADGERLSGSAGIVNATYGSKHFDFESGMEWISPGFRAENGFVTRSDVISVEAETNVNTYPTKGPFPFIQYQPLEAEVAWTFDGELRDVEINPAVLLVPKGGEMLWLYGEHVEEAYEGEWLEYDRLGFRAGRRFAPWLMVFGSGSHGSDAYYDEDDPRVGRSTSMGGFAAFRPKPFVSLSVEGQWERFLDTDDSLLYNAWYGRYRLELYANRYLWLRMIVDQTTDWADDEPDSFGGEALVAWERRPGQAIYVGGATDWDDPVAWQVFTKVAWVFSP